VAYKILLQELAIYTDFYTPFNQLGIAAPGLVCYAFTTFKSIQKNLDQVLFPEIFNSIPTIGVAIARGKPVVLKTKMTGKAIYLRNDSLLIPYKEAIDNPGVRTYELSSYGNLTGFLWKFKPLLVTPLSNIEKFHIDNLEGDRQLRAGISPKVVSPS
jgi:hypothetical protein